MRSTLSDLAGKRVLLAASTGGHLAQLVRLAPLVGVDPSSPWVTFDSPQSRGLLRGQDVHFVPYVAPRDLRGAVRAARLVRPLMKATEGALSTGAGLAVGVLPQARAAGRPAVYIESISRVLGPSMSGHILRRTPGVGLYTQHSAWAATPWKVGPSVLSTYSAGPRLSPTTNGPLKVLVTLGTIAPYRFDRMVDLVKFHFATHREPVELVWQLGSSTRGDLTGEVHESMPSVEFKKRLAWADVVISHAGVGTAMEILDAGHVPVLLARQARLGEHVDDHQRQIFDFLLQRGLAFDAERVLTHPSVIDEVLTTAAHV